MKIIVDRPVDAPNVLRGVERACRLNDDDERIWKEPGPSAQMDGSVDW